VYNLLCSNCGGRIDIPLGFAKGRIRCPECGVYNDVPSHLRERATESSNLSMAPPVTPGTRAPEVVRRAEDTQTNEIFRLADEPVTENPSQPTNHLPGVPDTTTDEEPREVLLQGTDDDDLNPYTVYGDAPTKACPHCSHRLPVKAVVCTNCGYHFEIQRPVKRRYEPIYRYWDHFWSPRYRIIVFVGLQIGNLVSLILVLASGRSPATMILTVVSAVMLQTFLCGTFDGLELERTTKGKVTLRSHWRIAFIPVAPRDLAWKNYESVTVLKSSEDFDFIGWIVAIILFCYFVIPGVLFWYYVLHRDKYTVILCRGHGFPDTPIYRTLDERVAMDVRDTVSNVTGLPTHH
jgi:DNA-directed RNA polymerase subunit RPC12/RpoP